MTLRTGFVAGTFLAAALALRLEPAELAELPTARKILPDGEPAPR